MWGVLGSVVSATVNATYATAGYVGLVSTEPYEQPPYPCAWPLKDITALSTEELKALSQEHHDAVFKLLPAAGWQPVEFVDPEESEGGDMKLQSKDQIGTYHFVKTTLSIKNVTPQRCAQVIYSKTLKERQVFSADTTGFDILDNPTDTMAIQLIQFWAPPPVAPRDFVFLTNKLEHSDGSIEIWGCSVAYDKAPEGATGAVRGSCLWGWRIIPDGEHCNLYYSNCSDPRGWVPGVIFAWIKTAVAKEFVNVRAVIMGKKANVEHVKFEDAGVSAEEVQKELEAAQALAQ